MKRHFGWVCVLTAACGGSDPGDGGRQLNDAEREAPRSVVQCPKSARTPYFVAYDITGDGHPDARRFVAKRKGSELPVPSCRETDLDGDGIFDLVTIYSKAGRPEREIADRDFDGKIDRRAFYSDGTLMWQELDVTHDGRLETRVYFDDGAPIRAERDLAGRSREGDWKPDTWEYYEKGALIRVGHDTDGDGLVDNWERSDELSKALVGRIDS